MKSPLPMRRLPERPDLEQLKRQAKELLEGFLAGEPHVTREVNRFYRDAKQQDFALHHAQLVLARSYGFESWPRLKAYVDGTTISRLIEAVTANDVDQVTAILSVRPELVNREAPAGDGRIAIHYAVMERMPEMVRTLMRFGADPHATTAGIHALRAAATPLTLALERGDDEIACIISEEQKKRENKRSSLGDKPSELQCCFESGAEESAIDLLTRHPDLLGARFFDSRWSPLHVSSALLWPRLAGWLLDHGANANEIAGAGCTPLDVTGRFCDPSETPDRVAAVSQLLLSRGAKPTVRSAVILGDEAELRKKIAEEDGITPRDDRGWLLRLAVDCNRPLILKLLLELGLDPDARVRVEEDDRIIFTWGMPLYECARAGKHAMAEMLLEHGADPNGQVYASGTPLSEAYGQRDERMIALLERYGGKTNASMAGLYRRADVARRLLLEFGDTPLPDDGFAQGPVAEQLLGAAARGGDPDILRMAMDRVAIPQGDIRWNRLLAAPLGFWNHWIGPWCHHEWDRSTYLTCFQMLLEKSGPPNTPLNSGATVLHQIMVMGDHVMAEERTAFARAALDAGARTDMRDDLLLSTPLGWACRWGREELVRLLLERGADPVERDAKPWATPLAWAEKKGHVAIAKLLTNRAGSASSRDQWLPEAL